MTSRNKWACFCVVGGLLLIYLAVPGGHASEDQNGPPPASNGKLRELLEERYEVLKTFVETQKRLLEIGQGSPRRLAEATAAMLRAKADLLATHSERIKVHEEIVKIMRQMEVSLAREAEQGLATPADTLNVKLMRLEAEITLEKMKLSHQKPQ